MLIQRKAFLDRLIERRENGEVKIVSGIRRCGKTFLLFELYRDYLRKEGVPDDHVIEVALDVEANDALRDPLALDAYVRSRITDSRSMYYVLLDEVQFAISDEERRSRDIPMRLYGVLNGFLRMRNVDVYITGSNSKFLSSDIRTEFRGRGDEVRVHPLSFSEYLPVHGGDREDAWLDYVTYGGLPRILTYTSDEGKAKYLNRLLDRVYLDDIVERNNLANEEAIGSVLDVLASGAGSLTNPATIARTFASSGRGSIDEKTVRSYINYMKDAFLISEVSRYDVKGRKYIGSPYKYYFEDLGLRNARLNFRQQEENHLMENAIYNELVGRGFSVDVGVVHHEERNQYGKREVKSLEIDFICNQASRRYYIQSAFAIPNREKMEQEQKSLVRVRDSFKKIIVVKDRIKPWHNDEGILVVGLIDFLLDPSIIDR